MNYNMWGGTPPGHRPKVIVKNHGRTRGAVLVKKWDRIVGVRGGMEAAVRWYWGANDPLTGEANTTLHICHLLSEEYDHRLTMMQMIPMLAYWRHQPGYDGGLDPIERGRR